MVQAFSCEFCKISKNTFLCRTPLVADSALYFTSGYFSVTYQFYGFIDDLFLHFKYVCWCQYLACSNRIICEHYSAVCSIPSLPLLRRESCYISISLVFVLVILVFTSFLLLTLVLLWKPEEYYYAYQKLLIGYGME